MTVSRRPERWLEGDQASAQGQENITFGDFAQKLTVRVDDGKPIGLMFHQRLKRFGECGVWCHGGEIIFHEDHGSTQVLERVIAQKKLHMIQGNGSLIDALIIDDPNVLGGRPTEQSADLFGGVRLVDDRRGFCQQIRNMHQVRELGSDFTQGAGIDGDGPNGGGKIPCRHGGQDEWEQKIGIQRHLENHECRHEWR